MPILKSPASQPTSRRQLLRINRPSSFGRILRSCQLSTELRYSVERLGWVGEQLLHPPLRQIAEGLATTVKIASDVQWLQLCGLRDALVQIVLTHVESASTLHQQQQ